MCCFELADISEICCLVLGTVPGPGCAPSVPELPPACPTAAVPAQLGTEFPPLDDIPECSGRIWSRTLQGAPIKEAGSMKNMCKEVEKYPKNGVLCSMASALGSHLLSLPAGTSLQRAQQAAALRCVHCSTSTAGLQILCLLRNESVSNHCLLKWKLF